MRLSLGLRYGFGPHPSGEDEDVWEPADLFAASEQGGWWDPSDSTTVFQDSAGTTPAGVGDPVGRIKDKSGRGNHLIQSAAASRPLLQTEGGRNFLLFDGTDDALAIAALDLSAGDAVTICTGLHKLTDTGATTFIWEATSSFSTTQGGLTLRHDLGNGDAFEFGTRGSALSLPGSAASAVGSSKVVTCLGDISTDLARLRVNQVETTAATDQGTGNYANAAFSVGRRANTASPTNMRLYGMAIIGRVVTADELTALEAWMNGKTGGF